MCPDDEAVSQPTPADESVLFTKKKRTTKPKVDLEPLRLFAQEIAYAEQAKAARYLTTSSTGPRSTALW